MTKPREATEEQRERAEELLARHRGTLPERWPEPAPHDPGWGEDDQAAVDEERG